MSLFDTSGAIFSPCRTWRYVLYRKFNESNPLAVYCMLNPSTADERVNDPTVERCCRRAIMLGFGSVIVLNIFALRSTDPSVLYRHADPVGPENDQHISEVAHLVSQRPGSMFICAWGHHGRHMNRGAAVFELIQHHGIEPKCLGVTHDGYPRHPLYVSYSVQPENLKCMPLN